MHTIHPIIMRPDANLRSFAHIFPDGTDIAPAGMVRVPAPGDSAVAASAIKVEIFDFNTSDTALPRSPALTPSIYKQIEDRRNVFDASHEEANTLASRCLRGSAWLHDGFPDAAHVKEIILPHLMTRAYYRRNMTLLRPCIASLKDDAELKLALRGFPERDEVQFFLLHAGLSQHQILQSFPTLHQDIKSWARLHCARNPVGKPIYVDAPSLS